MGLNPDNLTAVQEMKTTEFGRGNDSKKRGDVVKKKKLVDILGEEKDDGGNNIH